MVRIKDITKEATQLTTDDFFMIDGATNGTQKISPENIIKDFYGHKNLIINGDMVIDQRNEGGSLTISSDDLYTLDCWRTSSSQANKYSVQQSPDAPANFNNSLKVTSLSAYTLASNDYFGIAQKIEGFNTAKLAFGTSNAKTITISFWVKSSLTGAFGGVIKNSAGTRSYPFSYIINNANTWEKKTVTIAGDMVGTWIGATNGNGLSLIFDLGSGTNIVSSPNSWQTGNYNSVTGATSLVSTSGATWQLTGVQLEQGFIATDYEYRPYGAELELCKRYFRKSYQIGTKPATVVDYGAQFGYMVDTYDSTSVVNFGVSMRTVPSIIVYSPNTGASGYSWDFTSSSDRAMGVFSFSDNGFRAGFNNNAVFGHIHVYHFTADASL